MGVNHQGFADNFKLLFAKHQISVIDHGREHIITIVRATFYIKTPGTSQRQRLFPKILDTDIALRRFWRL